MELSIPLPSDNLDSIPEWGDPYIYPAGYDGFVSYHPPGSEGWPYPTFAYLRPWPPRGATSSHGPYHHGAWPIVNGTFGDTSRRSRGTSYPLANQPLFNLNGNSRPGPMALAASCYSVPKELIIPAEDSNGIPRVTLNYDIRHHPSEPTSLVDVSLGRIDYLSSFDPDSLSAFTTIPPCKWMELEHPRYPWKIVVTAKIPQQGCLAGVTVEDVFQAICTELQKEVTPVEGHSVPGTWDALRRQRAAITTRDGSDTIYTRLRRMHWLGTRIVRFLGISPDPKDPACWKMHFMHDELPERPLPPIPDDPPDYPWQEQYSWPDPTYIVLQRDGQVRIAQRDRCGYPHHTDRKHKRVPVRQRTLTSRTPIQVA